MLSTIRPCIGAPVPLLQLATVSNDNGLGGLAAAAAKALDLLHDVHALGHASKDHMLAYSSTNTIRPH